MKTAINMVLAITLLGAIGVENVYAQTCNENISPTTPGERFLDNGDGTVTDKYTALIWMRCSLGQTWDGSTCSDNAALYTWQEALQEADVYTYAGSSAWRLPDINQLQSIVERSCYDPAINLSIFPQTPPNYFWAASPNAFSGNYTWIAHFGYGFVHNDIKSNYWFVRLVRPDTIGGDEDGDGVLDESDNCVLYANPDQLNTDGDAQGNVCDADDDNDGILDVDDDNPLVADTDAVTVTIDGISQIENGTITPTQPRVVHQGKPLEYTVIADSGYFAHIFGCDGELVGTTFTIPSVDGVCSISISFKPPTAPLNDTGITRCGNADNNDLDCSQAGFPGQDAEFGRDVTHNNDSDGHAGFSFTKICNSGEAAGEGSCPVNPSLGAGANEWACTRDNVTSLMWEVKTDDGGLRDKDNTYSWYNSDSNINGGDAGTENGGACADAGNCDTEKYVASVNAVGLCGNSDWRLPDPSELRSIVNSATFESAIDAVYFSNAVSDRYWTASTLAVDSSYAHLVNFNNGINVNLYKSNDVYMRLVRSDSN